MDSVQPQQHLKIKMGSDSKYKVKTIEVKPKGGGSESKSGESKTGMGAQAGGSKAKKKGRKSTISREDTRVFSNPDQMSVPKGGCIINPKKTGKWDATMIICLVFTAVVTPYEVGFLDSSVINGLWVRAHTPHHRGVGGEGIAGGARRAGPYIYI